ncbi:beta strand repeat-containing protein [Novosphingobium sp.]|uniref:beta strand repeat-containing protein n=1 Tax=Novosphingobium sp. TaxID=1874826 RepID=UPI003D118981
MTLSGAGATVGIGNAGNNIITAGTTGAFLTGGGGNDVLVGGAGKDTFAVYAGQGSDAIYNFDVANDQIQLIGFALGGYAGLMTHATQVGADVVLALGSAGSVVIRNVTLASLSAKNFVINADSTLLAAQTKTVTAAAVSAVATKTLAGADTGWTYNGWYAITDAWGCSALKYGVNYTDSVTFNPYSLTTGTTFNWSVPIVNTALGSQGTILAYPSIQFGASPQSGTTDATDLAAVFPVRVGNLTALTTSFNIAVGGDTSGFDVAYDIWLTSVPGGNKSTITNEIMIWLHQGSFQPSGTRVGNFTDGSFTASIYYNAATHYTAVVANQDVSAGTIDILKLFTTLEGMGIVNKNEYLASSSLGAEAASGAGTLTVNALTYNVASNDGAGTTITDSVTGAVTTKAVTSTVAGHTEIIGGNGMNAASPDAVTLTNGGTVNVLTNSNVSVVGNGVTIKAAASDTLNILGSSDSLTLVGSDSVTFAQAIGHATLAGWTSTDQITLNKASFGAQAAGFNYWAHLLGSATSSGGNTTIMIDANDSIVLKGVTLTAANASQFHFA